MAAKPVIDILVVVKDIDQLENYKLNSSCWVIKKYPNDSHAYWYEKKPVVDALLEEALYWHKSK